MTYINPINLNVPLSSLEDLFPLLPKFILDIIVKYLITKGFFNEAKGLSERHNILFVDEMFGKLIDFKYDPTNDLFREKYDIFGPISQP